MKSSRFQHPTSREHPITNQQTQTAVPHWSLELGASLNVGAWCVLLLSACLVLLPCSTARSQTYSIDWFTIDGGGGTSTGGVYSVSGTIGQPDAGGPMTGGNFSLVGGFWSLFAQQTPGAPLLTIRLTATNTALVSWTFPSTGFSLQQNASLAT